MLIISPEDITELYDHPVFEKNRDQLKDLFFCSKHVMSDPQLLLQFQKSILEYIIKIEQFISKIKVGNDDEKSNVRAYKHLIRVLKWIMDGVVLRLLKFDSNAYRVLSESGNPGYLYGKDGLECELEKLEECYRAGETAILNGLTNFLRLGDITKIDYDNHKIELIECKYNNGKSSTGKNNPNKKTLSLQEKKMKEAEEMFNTYTPVPKVRGSGRMIVTSFKAHTFLNKINSEIRKAYRDGHAFCEIDEFVRLHIFYKKDFSEALDLFHSNTPDTTDKHYIFSNFDTFIDKEGEFFHTVFPFSVLKLPIDMVLDLMIGKLFLIIDFNFTNYYSRFKSLGYNIVEVPPKIFPVGEMMSKKTSPLELSPVSSIQLEKNGYMTTLPDTFVPRIVFEFICTDSFIELIEDGYNNRSLSLKGTHLLSLFKNHLSLYR